MWITGPTITRANNDEIEFLVFLSRALRSLGF